MSNIKLVHSGGNSVSLTTPTSNPASNVTFKLPQSDGSAGQVLKTDGNGNLSWVTLPTDTNDNTWVKLATTSITSDVSSVQFLNSSITGAFDTYKTYAVLYSNIRPVVDDSEFRLRVFQEGSEHTTSDYRTRIQTESGDQTINGDYSRLSYNGVGNHVNSGAPGGAAYYEDISGIIYMTGFPDRLRWKAWSNSVFEDNSGTIRRQDTGTGTQTYTETTGLSFYFNNGNISGATNHGKFTLYGIAT